MFRRLIITLSAVLDGDQKIIGHQRRRSGCHWRCWLYTKGLASAGSYSQVFELLQAAYFYDNWLQIAEIKSYLNDKNAPFGVDLLIPQVGGNARKTNVSVQA